MSPVRQAVRKLEGAVDGLEQAVRQQGSNQPDMFFDFSGPSNQNATLGTTKKRLAPTIDAVAAEKKINSAIDKVEALLRQG